MSQSKLMLSRAQLEAFLGKKDPDAIRAFERLFAAGDLVESGFGVPRGHIDGFILSNAADADHDITISAGEATDSTGIMMLSSDATITKRIDAPWSEGDGMGGLDTGVVAANSVYYMWRIYKATDKSLDAVFSLSKTAPTLAAVYTHKRRIGTVITDASANIINFSQFPNGEMRFKNPIDSLAMAGLANTSRNAYTVTAPPSMVALLQVTAQNSADTAVYYLWVGDANRTDAAASATNYTHKLIVKYGACGFEMRLETNSSKQIYARGTSTNIALGIVSLGWVDDRGKDAA